jgi:hypothetical protein
VLRPVSRLVFQRVVPAVVAVASHGASPAVGEAPSPKEPQQFEMWVGAEAFARVWALYSGGNYAPFGDITKDGFRVRVVGGYSQYSYVSSRWTGTQEKDFRFHGANSFADLIAGYHKQLGPLTIKILGGVTLIDRTLDDPEPLNAGTDVGAKALLELWWNVSERTWTSLDLSWTTLEDVYGARARLGWRAWPLLSLGIEGGALTNQDYRIGRLGAFVRYEWAGGELSLSGGIADNDFEGSSADSRGPYATINLLTRF